MYSVVILFAIIHPLFATKFPFTTYTHVSKAFDGTVCLTGCSPDTKECIINWEWDKVSCQTYEVAPIYRTSQFVNPQSKYCLSNCGYFGYPYEWCITTRDLQWDYCSTYASNGITNPDKAVARTRFQQICVNKCSKVETPNTGFYWCHYINNQNQQKWEYCALPALPRIPVLSSTSSSTYSFGDKLKGKCDEFLKYLSEIKPSSFMSSTEVPDNYIVTLADAIETTEGKTLVSGAGSIESYNMMTINDISVPVIVRAHITNSTIQKTSKSDVLSEYDRKLRLQMSNNHNGYKAGYLISPEVGGSNSEYNVVPKAIDWECDDWLDIAIKNWCFETGGSVDILIVVFYVDANTPVPRGFGISQTFRNYDNSLFVDCREKIHWNNIF